MTVRYLSAIVGCVAALGALACTVSANVGDLDALPPEGGADGAPNEATANDGGTDAAVTEAASPDSEAPIDAGCGVDFAQKASFVDVAVVQGAPPNPVGGTIVLGMYELTALRVYFGPSTGTMQVRETIRVRGSATAGTFDILTEARAATGTFESYALHGETRTWQTTVGPGILITPECPTADFEQGHRFDVMNDTLMLFDDQEGIERIYQRIP